MESTSVPRELPLSATTLTKHTIFTAPPPALLLVQEAVREKTTPAARIERSTDSAHTEVYKNSRDGPMRDTPNRKIAAWWMASGRAPRPTHIKFQAYLRMKCASGLSPEFLWP